MLHNTHDPFHLDDRQFDTPKGPVTARIVNTPENSSAENSAQRWFRISFSDGRNVMIVLSDERLLDDPNGSYHEAPWISFRNGSTTADRPRLSYKSFR